MRVCAAQLKPSAGDIGGNVAKHLALIEVATSHAADLVFFPELSLTGYQPRLARALATSQDDRRLDVFQQLADARGVIIGVGIPTTGREGIHISMILFQPDKSRLTYSKQQLHADELPFFVHGDEQIVLQAKHHTLAPAICYESLQPEHAGNAANEGADIYLASVAKSNDGVARAYAYYPSVARQHSMTVLMANCLGPCDDFVGVGQSAIWNPQGKLAAKLDDEREGLVMIDTATGEAGILLY
jgi:predicted amidohydrolase